MTEPAAPWLDALRVLRSAAGYPAYRVIARGGEISHTQVADVFNGVRVPSRRSLEKILAGLNVDTDAIGYVLTLYDAQGMRVTPRTAKRTIQVPGSIDRLTEAIGDLTDAVKQLTEQLKKADS